MGVGIEISFSKDLADKMKLSLSKTGSTEPDIHHWYAKVLIFNRKRYVLAVNTRTRFALIFRLNSKAFADDFKAALKKELENYEMDTDFIEGSNITFSLGNNRASTAQLSRVGQEIEYVFHEYGYAAYEGDYADLFGDYNKHNLGIAGNNKEMTFAVDEMRRCLNKA